MAYLTASLYCLPKSQAVGLSQSRFRHHFPSPLKHASCWHFQFKWEACKSQAPIEHCSELYQASTCWDVLYRFFVFSWLEHWQPSQIPLREDKLYSDMWPLSDSRLKVWIAFVLGQLLLPPTLLTSWNAPSTCLLLSSSYCFPPFFFKVKHRSFCFMSPQLSGLPRLPPTTNWSKWKGIHLLEWDWPMRPAPVGSVDTLHRGDCWVFVTLLFSLGSLLRAGDLGMFFC